MLSDDQLKAKVRARLAHLKRSPIEAAEKGGLGRDYLRDWLSDPPRKESINRSKQKQVAFGLDWSEDELLAEDLAENYYTLEALPFSAQVPEMRVTGGAAYGGGISDEEAHVDESGAVVSRDAVRAQWGILAPFLRDELHLQIGQVHILPVRGDSMTDALYDGDRALIDLTDTDISQGGIFALVNDIGAVIIKQVELVPGNKGRLRIRCKSRNPQYEPFELFLDDPVKIIGRVACKITRL